MLGPHDSEALPYFLSEKIKGYTMDLKIYRSIPEPCPKGLFKQSLSSLIKPFLSMKGLDLTISDSTAIAHGTGAILVHDKVAGVAVTAGQVVYLDPAQDKWELAQCDGTTTESGYGTQLGMAMNDAAEGQFVTVQTAGTISGGFTAGVSTVYVVSNTAGNLMPIADFSTSTWYLTLFAVGATASTLNLGVKQALNIQYP